jgi:hypothetical protein
MKTGIELMAAERQEQITKHGRTIEKDIDQNPDGELIVAAIGAINGNDASFPAGWDLVLVQKICDKGVKDRLIIAGALIAAEIDRLQNNPH